MVIAWACPLHFYDSLIFVKRNPGLVSLRLGSSSGVGLGSTPRRDHHRVKTGTPKRLRTGLRVLELVILDFHRTQSRGAPPLSKGDVKEPGDQVLFRTTVDTTFSYVSDVFSKNDRRKITSPRDFSRKLVGSRALWRGPLVGGWLETGPGTRPRSQERVWRNLGTADLPLIFDLNLTIGEVS